MRPLTNRMKYVSAVNNNHQQNNSKATNSKTNEPTLFNAEKNLSEKEYIHKFRSPSKENLSKLGVLTSNKPDSLMSIFDEGFSNQSKEEQKKKLTNLANTINLLTIIAQPDFIALHPLKHDYLLHFLISQGISEQNARDISNICVHEGSLAANG